MPQHYIIEIDEYLNEIRDDSGFVVLEGECSSFRVSTRKLENFRNEDGGFRLSYVEGIIEGALRGQKHRSASRKYSFGDCPEWYSALEPDADCQDPVIRIDVDVNR